MNKKGFTLIEFLIYGTIVTFVMGVLVMMGVNILYGRVTVNSMKEVNKNAVYSFERIASAIREANDVVSAEEGSLVLEMPVTEDDPTEISLDEGIIKIKRGEQDLREITTEEVTVTHLQFNEENGKIDIEAVFEFYNPGEQEEYELIRSFRTVENVRR